MADTVKTGDLDAMLAARGGRSGPVRDLRRNYSERTGGGRVFMTPFGWLLAVGSQVALVAAIVFGILAVPPLLACHDQDKRGFFGGGTFGACVRTGISARLTDFDQQVRQVILGSGR